MSEEMQGWPKEDFFLDDFAPERKIIVPWSTRFNEADSIDTVEYQYAPGCGAYPVHIGIEPLDAQTGSPSPLASYEKAVLTVRYSSKRSTEGAVTEFIEPNEGIDRRVTGNLYWAADNPIDARNLTPPIRPGCVYHRIRRKVAIVPAAALGQAGYVNSNLVYSVVLGIGFNPGFLRARVPGITRTWTQAGLTSYSIHQQFVYRYNGGHGWNSQYNPETGSYAPIYNEASVRIYDYPLTAFYIV